MRRALTVCAQTISIRLLPLAALMFGAGLLAPAPLLAEQDPIPLPTPILASTHGLAMHGAPLLPPDFQHFTYVNPDAPKGGDLRLARTGRFDSLNPFIIKGRPAPGLRNYMFESLLARHYDEPFSLYGLLAGEVATDESRQWVAFTLREEARFSNGEPVRVEDVFFSVRLLREEGRPNHRYYYGKIKRMVKTGARSLRFEFDTESDREMPLIMGLMPVLSEKAFAGRSFDKTTLEPLIGSGPYKVAQLDAGKQIIYEKDPNWWGKHLAVNRGRYNPERIIYSYFRNKASAFQAFQGGEADYWIEDQPRRWAETPYQGLDKAVFPSHAPAAMWALVFNTRRPQFVERALREAIALIVDINWINQHLFHGLYQRTGSFFARSALSSYDRPASPAERALLRDYAGEMPEAFLERGYAAFAERQKQDWRTKRRQVHALMQAAGMRIENGVYVDKNGEALGFEILSFTQEEERLALVVARQLQKAGISARVSFVNSATYQNRVTGFDYDMIFARWVMSLSPGNEQHFYWSKSAAETEGSRNYPGIKSAGVEAMIEHLLAARSRERLVDAARALDRLLMGGHYIIPLFHTSGEWVVWREKVHWPERPSLYGLAPDSLWLEQPN